MMMCDRCGVRIKDMWQAHQYTGGQQMCKDCDLDWSKYCTKSRMKEWMRDNPK